MRRGPHGKVPLPFPPHVAEDVKQARVLRDLVQEQGRDGALGIVQGERALSRLEHHTEGGSHGGHGSRDQADLTPGAEPTRKTTQRGTETGGSEDTPAPGNGAGR